MACSLQGSQHEVLKFVVHDEAVEHGVTSPAVLYEGGLQVTLEREGGDENCREPRARLERALSERCDRRRDREDIGFERWMWCRSPNLGPQSRSTPNFTEQSSEQPRNADALMLWTLSGITRQLNDLQE